MRKVLWSLLATAVIGAVICVVLFYLQFPRDFHGAFLSAHPDVTVLGAEIALLLEDSPPPKESSELAKEIAASPLLHEHPVKLPWHSIYPDLSKVQNLMMGHPLYEGYLADCFSPGFVLRLKTNRGLFALFVCLECSQVQIVDPEGKSFQVQMSDLGKLHWKAMFVDEFVLRKVIVKTP